MSATIVQVNSAEVEAIVFAGKNLIAATRLVKLDEAIEAATTYQRWTFYGRVPAERTREQALEFLKRPSENMFMSSVYHYLTEEIYSGHERRLTELGNMAKSSVDGTMWLDTEDHKLIRLYAGKVLGSQKEATE